jgi:hypothetical protein
MNYKMIVFILIFSLLLISCGKGEKEEANVPGKKESVIKNFLPIDTVKQQIEKFAPVEIGFDDSGLTDNEKKALDLIFKAAKVMDRIFLRQVYEKNEALENELINGDKPEYTTLRDYFKINFGPFDRLEEDKPFINLEEKKPDGANYYPADMTKEEFEAYLQANPDDEKAFKSEFTVIRRKEGKLVAVPYSEEYKYLLGQASQYLKEAAQLIENPTLKTYLNSRAEAFASNDYYQSDIDWVLIKDQKIELVIGPYEVYEDKLFNFKAAFECFITLVDEKESEKLAVLGTHLDDMEKNSPVEDKYKNFKRGKQSPIFVANEVFTAGDTKSGIQTIAFNLPNNEEVRQSTGSKKVMLKNVCEAKFKTTWTPIANEVLAEAELPYASFEAFFNHILMHEISHGLGPGTIEKDGKETTVNRELKELYSVIEEAKADILGLYNFQYLIDQEVFPKKLQENIYVTYLGGIFRSVRFGIDDAHGGANAIQLNYIMEKGGFSFDEAEARFSVNKDMIRDAVKDLTHDILMIEALGDYAGAGEMIAKYRKASPEMEKALAKVEKVPTDIRPIYAIEK